MGNLSILWNIKVFINQGLDKHLGPGMFYPENLKSLRFRESGIQYVEEAGYTVLRQRYIRVVSNCWTGLWTGSLDWIAGLDCWTGLLDWIAGLDSEQRCQTSMQDCMCSEGLCLARSYGRS